MVSNLLSAKNLHIGALILLVFGYFLNLGLHPLVLEEPRRAIIALEMLENGNLWVPTWIGEYYYKKPPVFNWVLLFSAWLNGGPSELAFRIPTVLSVFGISLLLFFTGRRYYTVEMGVFSAFLFALSVDILFSFSILAEIDLFYSLITFGSILSVFHFYQQQQYYRLFFVAYLLGGIGLLTKGLPSLPFLALSIGPYLLYKRRIGLLFSPAHFLGMLVFALIVGGYFYKYSQYNELSTYFQVLWSESSDRTAVGSVFLSFLQHLINFPVAVLKNLLPATILLIFAFQKDTLSRIRRQEYVLFALLMFIANILIYWISPGSRQRYIYPIYPFAIIVLTHFYLAYQPGRKWQKNSLYAFALFSIGLLGIAGLAMPFIPLLSGLPYLFPMAVASCLISGLMLVAWRRTKALSLSWIILAFAIARILFSLIYLPLRAVNPEDVKKIEIASMLDQIAGDDPIYAYGIEDVDYPHTMVYYLNQLRPEMLQGQKQLQPGTYYLTLSPGTMEIIQTFTIEGQRYFFVRSKVD